MNRWFAIIALALALANVPADVTKGNFGAAKSDEPAPKKSRPAESKRSAYPFYGTLDSVDATKKMLTLRGKKKNRVVLLTTETRMQKNGSKAKLEDATPGERVSGSVRKNAEGNEEAITVRFGKKD